MKKFFALMLVVAMLSVAGSAMAVTISADSASLTSTQRAEVSTNVWVLPENEGILSVDVYSGTASGWTFVALSGDVTSDDDTYTVYKVTFAPTAAIGAGSFTAKIRARETYTGDDTVGHAQVTDVASTDIAVTVTVTTPVEPVQSKDVETLVISTDLATEQTASSAVSNVPSGARNKITTLGASGLKNMFQSAGIGGKTKSSTSMVTSVTAATGRNYNASGTSTAKEQNIANGSARFTDLTGGNNYRGVSTTSPLTVDTEGYLSMKQTVDTTFADYQPIMNTFKYSNTGHASVGFAAAVDVSAYNEAIFFDNSGNSIDKIPSNGEFTAVIYVEPGYVYEPVLAVYVSNASADAFNTATGSVSRNVTIIVPSDEPTPPTPVDSGDVFPSGKNFTVHVGAANKAALATLTGLSLDEIPVTTVSIDQTRSSDELYIGTIYVEEVALIPRLQNLPANAAGHGYVAAFKYDKLVNSRTITSSPLFVPDWSNGNAAGDVYAITGTTTKTARVAVSGDVYTGNTGYLVFRVSGDTIAFSTSAASFADPRLVAASSPTTPSTDYPEGTSSSSGGCSAGSAALALAVLGSFILTRKK